MIDIDEVSWNKEYAAQKVTQLLLVSSGQGTLERCSILGATYITFTQDGIKEEGAKMLTWGNTPFEAWSMYLRHLESYYFNIPAGSKIYWRTRPELSRWHEVDGKTPIKPVRWGIWSRFVIGSEG